MHTQISFASAWTRTPYCFAGIFRHRFLLALFTLIWLGLAQASWPDIIKPIEPLGNPGVVRVLDDGNDDGSAYILASRTFYFYGVPYQGLTINNNGVVTFGNTGFGSYNNYSLPQSDASTAGVYCLWDDLVQTNTGVTPKGYVYYKEYSDGVAITWVNCPHYNNFSGDGRANNTFQIFIYNSSGSYPGDLALGYLNCDGVDRYTVGINKGDGTEFSSVTGVATGTTLYEETGHASISNSRYRFHYVYSAAEGAIKGHYVLGAFRPGPPTTYIVSGPHEGDTLCTNSITVTYTGVDDFTGTEALKYQYKLDDGATQGPTSSTTLTLNNLADGLHHLTIAAIDGDGNVDPTPPTLDFTTESAPPVISALAASDLTTTSATITWTTDKLATSQADYRLQGTTDWISTRLDTTLVTSHSVALSGLTSATYEYRVHSMDGCDHAAVSAVKTFTTPNPLPALTSLSPISSLVNTAGLTLTLNGTGFVAGATVNFGGVTGLTPITGTLTATQLKVAIPDSALNTGGFITVTVSNPAPGGGTSNGLTFSVLNPVPALTSLTPASTPVNTTGLTLTLNGTGFVAGATVNFGTLTGLIPVAGSITAKQLQIVIPDSVVTKVGSVNVTVSNPAPGGGTSNGLPFSIQNPVPALTSLSPTSSLINTTGLTLTLNGTGFVAGTTISFGGVTGLTPIAGTLTATQLKVAIPDSALNTGGFITVTVSNPAPGGGTSNGLTFSVLNPLPVLTSLNPASASLSTTGLVLTLNGTGFVAGATVNFGGVTGLTPIAGTLTATQLKVAIPDSALNTVGSVNITVTNPTPGGGTSNSLMFSVTNPVPKLTNLSPISTMVNTTGLTLTITGNGFLPSTTVSFGDLSGLVPVTGTLTPTQLQVIIPDSALITARQVAVSVISPGPGGGLSNTLTFSVTNPAPKLTSLSPTSTSINTTGLTLTLNGTGFVAGTTISFGGVTGLTPIAGTLTATQLKVAIPDSALNTGGFITVTVSNPAPGGGTSNGLTFSVLNPVPVLTSLSPTSTSINTAGLTLTLQGGGFDSATRVNFGSVSGLVPIPGSLTATQLQVVIPDSALNTGRVVNVTVSNPAPGGGTSNGLTFSVLNPLPVLTSLSPASTPVNTTGLTLTITGGGFVVGTRVSFGTTTGLTPLNGTLTATQFQVRIPDSALTTVGPVNVTVSNPTPGGGTSNAVVFTINPLMPDLKVLSVTAPVLTYTDSSFDLIWKDSNQGHAVAAGPWQDYVYISPDTNPAHGTQIGDFKFDGTIAAGNSVTRDQVVSIPRTAIPANGVYQILVVTDGSGRVTEENETNNAGSTALNVNLLPLPDLQVASVQAPSATTNGQTISVSFTIINKGAAATNSSYWSDHVYLSTTADLSGRVADLGTLRNGSYLAINQSYTTSKTFTLPLTLVGKFYVVVQTDDTNQVAEISENNNVGPSSAIEVTQGPIGYLHVSSVTTSPAPPSPIFGGSSVVVNWTVINTGTATIAQGGLGYWDDALALSPTPTYDGVHGIFLGGHNGTERPGPLGVGESYSHQRTISIPNDLSGTYYVVAIPDTHFVAGGPFSIGGSNIPRDTGSAKLVITPVATDDLIVSAASATSPTAPGQPVTIHWTVTNQGTDDTPGASWTDSIYLSPTATLDPSTAVFLGTVPHSGVLGAGMDYSQNALLTPPLCLSGTYYLIISTDAGGQIPEYDPTLDAEANNTRATSGTVAIAAAPIPDLIVPNVSAAGPVTAGTLLTLSWTVKNQGAGSAVTPWSDTIYLSQSAVFDGSARQVGNFAAPATLIAGSSYTQKQQVTVPSDLAGPYYVYVITNAGSQLNECSAGNNDTGRTNGTLQIIAAATPPPPALSALTVSQVTAPSSVQSGGTISLHWTVTNTGTAATHAGTWQDTIYLSATTGQLGKVLLSVPHSGDLTPGSSYQGSAVVPISVTTFGTYTLTVVPSLTPNTPASASINVTTYPLSDLLVPSVTAPASAFSGGSATISWRVVNTGDGPTDADAWDDTVYLSRTPVRDTTALPVGTLHHSGTLAVGNSYSAATSINIPHGLSGAYYVIVSTNTGKTVHEKDTTNNDGASSTVLQLTIPPLSDLLVPSVTAPASAFSGGSATVSWTVTNSGDGPTDAATWDDAVYLSRTPVRDATAIPVGTLHHTGTLAVGSSYSATTSVSLPSSLTGPYYVIVSTDITNQVLEKSETNNDGASGTVTQLAPLPLSDLLVPSVTAPATALSGASMTVFWRVVNSGDGVTNTDMWDDKVYLSRDQVHTPSDIPVGSLHHIGALALGSSYTASTPVTIPPGLSGPYFVIVATDTANQVLEKDETNNAGLSDSATQISLPPPCDLVVSSVTSPVTGIPGQPVTVSWTVGNQGANPAIGPWTDAVYLSASPTFDNTATLVGTVNHSGPLGVGQTYTGTLTAALPAVDLGQYYVFVRTNIYNTINEADLTNDVGIAGTQITVDVAELTPGTPATGALSVNDLHYYKVLVPAGETLSFTLTGSDANSSNEIYVRYGHLPDLATYDYIFNLPFSPNQAVTVPTTQAGYYYVLVRGNSEPHPETPYSLLAQIIPFSITSVSPNMGGSTGMTTVVVNGAGFVSGATVKLSGQGFIITPVRTLTSTGNALAITFDLRNYPLGLYDVIVTNPNGHAIVDHQAFQITSGCGSQLTMTIRAPGVVRLGSRLITYFVVQNNGCNDAYSVTVIPVVPIGSSPIIPSDQFSLPGINDDGSVNPTDDSPISTDFGPNTYIPTIVPEIPAGGTVEIPVEIGQPDGPISITGATIDGTGGVLADIPPQEGSPEKPDLTCAATLAKAALGFVVDKVLESIFPTKLWGKCAKEATSFALDYAADKGAEALTENITGEKEVPKNSYDGVISWGFKYAPYLLHTVKTALTCGAALVTTVSNANPEVIALKIAASALADTGELLDPYFTKTGHGLTFGGAVYDCLIKPREPTIITQLVPHDPNDKIGSLGAGTQQWVSASQPLPYTIDFQNVATATAPAHRITITDSLDPNVNPRTFRLGEITFGDTTITVPANRSFYQTQVQLGPAHGNLLASVTAGIDVANHQAIWSLVAIDPATNLETQDPTIGLLPPDDTTHRGEGHVLYTVTPTAGVATGTMVSNTATIVFDTNDPINTNTWTNTLDAGTPTSRVTSLPATSTPTFIVSWSGQSGASALALTYDIYVSDNGGPFTAFLAGTSLTSAAFTGQPGHTYGFFSLAHDAAGNTENAKTTAEATTTVPAGLTDVTGQVKVTGSGLIYNRAKKTFNGTLTVVNTGTSGIAGPVQIVFSNLPAGVSLANATGTTGGDPYLTVSAGALPAGALVTVPAQFTNSGTAAIAYTNRVYSGTF